MCSVVVAASVFGADANACAVLGIVAVFVFVAAVGVVVAVIVGAVAADAIVLTGWC